MLVKGNVCFVGISVHIIECKCIDTFYQRAHAGGYCKRNMHKAIASILWITKVNEWVKHFFASPDLTSTYMT